MQKQINNKLKQLKRESAPFLVMRQENKNQNIFIESNKQDQTSINYLSNISMLTPSE